MLHDSRILIIDKQGWTGIARLPKALSVAGFRVATLSAPRALISLSQYVDHRIHWKSNQAKLRQEVLYDFLEQVARAVDFWKPHWLVPADDQVVSLLLDIIRGTYKTDSVSLRQTRALIVNCLGNSDLYPSLFNKTETLSLAKICGVLTPGETYVKNALATYDFIENHGLPIVLKVAISSAGRGVQIIKELSQVEDFFKLHGQVPTAAQRYIYGKPVLRTSIAYKGEDLSSLCFIKEKCFPGEQGPSSVVSWLNHNDIELATKTLIGKTNASGFLSFDFMLESKTNRPYLIECNLRPTPVAHLGAKFGNDLCKALFNRLNGIEISNDKHINSDTIALFPQEWQRAPDSSYIQKYYHDVPWDEPELLQGLLLKINPLNHPGGKRN